MIIKVYSNKIWNKKQNKHCKMNCVEQKEIVSYTKNLFHRFPEHQFTFDNLVWMAVQETAV